MGRECAYGFGDLHRAALGRTWSDEERSAFERLDHDARNGQVRAWAATSSALRTERRLGSDGRDYLAFWVELPAGLDGRLRGGIEPGPDPAAAAARLPEGPGVLVIAPGPVLVPRDVDLVRAAGALAAAGGSPPAFAAPGDERPRRWWWIESADAAAARADAATLSRLLEPRSA